MSTRFSLGEAIYAHFYRRRKREAEARRVHFENLRIISIGNLTVGGTGKTPAVQWVVRRLQRENITTVVIGRGYGGEYSSRGAIVSDGETILLDARQAGDEAVLHARALPSTPVVIGRDRVAAVKMAQEKFTPQVVVLDDGFQFWSLARDFDLVLMDARHPFGNGKLLPVGRLREPKSELARASGVLLTRADATSEIELQRAQNEIREFSSAPIFISRHAPLDLRNEASGEIVELKVLRAQRVAAFSALANNEKFFQLLSERGAEVESTLARRDHHQWRESEIRKFAIAAKRSGALSIITTEKDAVKIPPEWCAPLPLFSLRIELSIDREAELWQLIQRCLHSY